MSIHIGRYFGIPVEIDLSWLIVFALIVVTLALGYFPQLYPEFSPSTYWIIGIIAALLLFASVLVHELAHSVVAKRIIVGSIHERKVSKSAA